MQVRLDFVMECEHITAKRFAALNHFAVLLLLVFTVSFFCLFVILQLTSTINSV